MKRLLAIFAIILTISSQNQVAFSFYGGQKVDNSPYVVHFLPSQEFIPTLLLPDGNDQRPIAFKVGWCSGAVVHPYIVITDAHCIYDREISPNALIRVGWKVSYPGVQVGTNMEKASEIVATFHLSKDWYKSHDCPIVPIAPSPTCSPIGDIAALVIKDPLPVPSDLKIATADEVENFRAKAYEAIGFGYGLTEKIPGDNSVGWVANQHAMINYSKIIQNDRKAENAIYPKKYNGVFPKLVLTVEHKLNESSCSGDSGGPYYVKQNGVMYYIGTNAGTNWGICTEVPVNPKRNLLEDRSLTWISVLSYHNDVYDKALTFVNSDLPNLLEKEKAEAEAKAKAEAEAKAKAEAEAKAKDEAEAKATAEAEAKAKAKVEAEAKAKAEAEAKAIASKNKKTITCVKGKLEKRVTAKNPKCPASYKKK